MSGGLVTCYKGGLVPYDSEQKLELESRDIWVRGGKIVDPPHLFFRERRSPDVILDCSDHIVAPGFIDIQINGGFSPGGLLGFCVDYSEGLPVIIRGFNLLCA